MLLHLKKLSDKNHFQATLSWTGELIWIQRWLNVSRAPYIWLLDILLSIFQEEEEDEEDHNDYLDSGFWMSHILLHVVVMTLMTMKITMIQMINENHPHMSGYWISFPHLLSMMIMMVGMMMKWMYRMFVCPPLIRMTCSLYLPIHPSAWPWWCIWQEYFMCSFPGWDIDNEMMIKLEIQRDFILVFVFPPRMRHWAKYSSSPPRHCQTTQDPEF